MLACDAVSAVLLLSVPVASWFGVLTVAQLVGVALLAGASSVLFSTAYVAYLPSLIARDDLGEGNTKLQGSRSATRVAGPGMAGLLAQFLGAVVGLLADAITFVVSAVCLLAIRTREPAAPARERQPTRLRTEISEGLRLSYSDRYLRVFAIYGAAGNLALTGWQTLEVLFLVRIVHTSVATVGILLAVIGIGGVVGALCAGTIARRLGTARAVIVCAVGTTPFGLLTPLAGPGPRLMLFAAGGVIVGAGIAAGNVMARSFLQTYCPTQMIGRLTASARTLAYGAIPIGALLAGELGTLLGIRTAFWIMTSLLVAAGSILLAGPMRRDRQLPTQPAPRRTRLPVSTA